MTFVMAANSNLKETDLIDAAVAWLGAALPDSWTAERSERPIQGVNPGEHSARVDSVIDLRGANGVATFAVEAKQSFAPRDIERLLPGLTRTLRSLANVAVLVVAPWLSERTQELLSQEGINFIDLTGNALVRLDYPAVYIKTIGAKRNPEPQTREIARVRGPKAARLIRLLADVRPPYGVRELASAAGLTPGYVSRLLGALDREALVDRSHKGQVESVDVAALLRRWAETYDVLKTNTTSRFIAPEGPARAAQLLTTISISAVVTGSFAAVRHAPVAAPALLLVYADDVAPIADRLDLLPAEAGANVILLRPFDPVVWDRAATEDGVTYVAVSQAVVDCMTGTGRMPAEGEALLAWMIANESQWRANSLGELAAATPESVRRT